MDPYQVLGLPPGATQADVKRAYRRLAKALHPDSAGERSLPAFLAVQEAYEQLTGSKVGGPGRARSRASGSGTPRAGGGGGGGGAAGAGAGWQEPWRADPERARAAREQARARWGARAAGASRGSASGGGPAPAAGPAPGAGASPRGGRAGDEPPPSDGRRQRSTGTTGPGGSSGSERPRGPGADGPRRRRSTRKATMGSTSYDEARDASDPRWAGASWYGPTTGEYWIVNPREYADPRKHGPGYSSRGRTGWPPNRSTRGTDPSGGDAAAAAAGSGTPESGPDEAEAWRAWPPPPEARPDQARADAARADAARADQGRSDASPPAGQAFAPHGSGTAGDLGPAGAPSITERPVNDSFGVEAWARALTSGSPTDTTHRAGIALLAWAPVGIAAAAAINALTGCATYTVACDGTDQLLPWLAQAAIVGLLLLVPVLARVLAAGTLAMLLGLVPGVAFLIAFGGAHANAAGALLAVLAAVAWLMGIGWAIRVMLRASATGSRQGGTGSP